MDHINVEGYRLIGDRSAIYVDGVSQAMGIAKDAETRDTGLGRRPEGEP